MKKQVFCTIVLLSSWFATPARAADGVYLGMQGGHVGLSGGTFQSGLGFGGDLGFVVGPVVDLVFKSQFSSHDGGGGMTLWSNTLSADFHVGNFYDVDIALGVGPGLYRFGSVSRFGLHGELNTDVAVGDGWRAGLSWRYHGIMGGTVNREGSYWSVMARVGYLFEM